MENLINFLGTRKLWQQIISLILTVLVWAVPEYLGLEITPESQVIITTILWSIAGLVVYGDIKYDWNQQEVQKVIHSTKG